MELKKEEMIKVIGGGITSAWLNAITKGINALFDLGKHTGSAIRRIVTGSYCSVN